MIKYEVSKKCRKLTEFFEDADADIGLSEADD